MKKNNYNHPCVSVMPCKAISVLMASPKPNEIENGGKVSEMTGPKIVY